MGEKKYVISTANKLSAVANRKGDVLVELDLPDVGLAPDTVLVFRMLPADAREVAKLLLLSADEADLERGQSVSQH